MLTMTWIGSTNCYPVILSLSCPTLLSLVTFHFRSNSIKVKFPQTVADIY